MSSTALRNRLVGLIANFPEHYDSALFGLLAPFIAPLFFVDSDPFIALILTYGMLPLGFLTRPFGSIFFGRIGDRYGRKQALIYSFLGMASVSIAIGSIPVYKDIGIYAPLLLALGRMLQVFFAAGASAGTAIFILEHTPPLKSGWISSLYDAASIGGILIASALVTFASNQGKIEENWRILFWIGGITSVPAFFLLLTRKDPNELKKLSGNRTLNWINSLIEHRTAFFSIILASGFSHTTYMIGFTLMNGFIPLITDLSRNDVMQINTSLLVVDMILLPFFGFLTYKFSKEKIMFFAALFSAIGAVPLFSLLEHASSLKVIMIRLVLIIPGIAFAAPFYAWAMEKIPKQNRYLILSLGTTIGSQLIAAPATSICLWLYRITGRSEAPGIYLTMIAIGAIWVTRPLFKVVVSNEQEKIGIQKTPARKFF